jgi:hypothetical protein
MYAAFVFESCFDLIVAAKNSFFLFFQDLSAIIGHLEDNADVTEAEISGVPRLIELIDVVIDRLRKQIVDMGVAFTTYKGEVDKVCDDSPLQLMCTCRRFFVIIYLLCGR